MKLFHPIATQKNSLKGTEDLLITYYPGPKPEAKDFFYEDYFQGVKFDKAIHNWKITKRTVICHPEYVFKLRELLRGIRFYGSGSNGRGYIDTRSTFDMDLEKGFDITSIMDKVVVMHGGPKCDRSCMQSPNHLCKNVQNYIIVKEQINAAT